MGSRGHRGQCSDAAVERGCGTSAGDLAKGGAVDADGVALMAQPAEQSVTEHSERDLRAHWYGVPLWVGLSCRDAAAASLLPKHAGRKPGHSRGAASAVVSRPCLRGQSRDTVMQGSLR